MPVWSLPYTQYSLWCRQEALQNYRRVGSGERAAPLVRDGRRMPDASTVMRWLHRSAQGVLRWLTRYRRVYHRAPTMLAWDAERLWRTLIHESASSHGPPLAG